MITYSKIRTLLSQKNQGHFSRFLITTRIKPTCNRTAKSPFNKGIIIFSADFEMAWAFRFSKTKKNHAGELGLHERNNLPIILEIFNSYNIPVTWATVGHLFLDKCSRGENELPHKEMPRPDFFENRNWDFSTGDWYNHDPCTNVNSDPAWYASDLIDMIISSGTNHEIACHTFSHIDFTYEHCTKNLADAELDKCKELAELKGIDLKSMVFPGGTAGNYESLKEKGFICYRKPMKYHIDKPYIDNHGIVAIPSSFGLDKDPYGWTKEFHLKMIDSFLQKAIKYKLVCHFWFHPSMNIWYLENIIPDILRITANYREKNLINTMTMRELAETTLRSSLY